MVCHSESPVHPCCELGVVLEIRAIYEWSNASACVCQLTRSSGAVAYDCSGRGLLEIPVCVTNDATSL